MKWVRYKEKDDKGGKQEKTNKRDVKIEESLVTVMQSSFSLRIMDSDYVHVQLLLCLYVQCKVALISCSNLVKWVRCEEDEEEESKRKQERCDVGTEGDLSDSMQAVPIFLRIMEWELVHVHLFYSVHMASERYHSIYVYLSTFNESSHVEHLHATERLVAGWWVLLLSLDVLSDPIISYERPFASYVSYCNLVENWNIWFTSM